MRKLRKKWEGPFKRWDKRRIEVERGLMKTYGLKNKKELWKAATILRKIRKIARNLLAYSRPDKEQREKELMGRLRKYGLVKERATLDDVLSLKVVDILERRLQTVVWRKGLAKTVKEARQKIVHGHVMVGDRVITSPGYLVPVDEENKIMVRA